VNGDNVSGNPGQPREVMVIFGQLASLRARRGKARGPQKPAGRRPCLFFGPGDQSYSISQRYIKLLAAAYETVNRLQNTDTAPCSRALFENVIVIADADHCGLAVKDMNCIHPPINWGRGFESH
jgi:hypothetical protein